MPPDPTGDLPGEPRPTLVPLSAAGWRLWTPLAAVVLALAALVAVPILGEQYVRPLHSEMRDVAEPGRTQVTRLHVALAIEGAVLHDYLESRDTTLVQRYRASRADGQAAYDSLRPLTDQLGLEVARRFTEVDSLQRAWHDAVERYLRGDPEARRAAGSRSRGASRACSAATSPWRRESSAAPPSRSGFRRSIPRSADHRA